MLVSSSEGFCREGLFAAILLSADIVVVVDEMCRWAWNFEVDGFLVGGNLSERR